MNREDIIRMAREAGFDYSGSELTWESVICTDELERFAALVASAEREACIKIVENEAMQYAEPVWAFEIVNDIKARGNVATNDTSQKRVDKTSEIVHEPWSPVSIGVDITEEGAHVVGIYALDNDTSQVFYAKYYPIPQRKPLTDEEIRKANHHMVDGAYDYSFKQGVKWAEYKHGIKGEA